MKDQLNEYQLYLKMAYHTAAVDRLEGKEAEPVLMAHNYTVKDYLIVRLENIKDMESLLTSDIFFHDPQKLNYLFEIHMKVDSMLAEKINEFMEDNNG